MAGREFFIENAALAHGSVDEEAKGEGKIGLLGEIGDGLGLAVLIEKEVVFREGVDQGAVFVVNGGEEIDGGDVDGDGRGLLGDERGGEKIKEGQEAKDADGAARWKNGARGGATSRELGGVWRRRVLCVHAKCGGRASP